MVFGRKGGGRTGWVGGGGGGVGGLAGRGVEVIRITRIDRDGCPGVRTLKRPDDQDHGQ